MIFCLLNGFFLDRRNIRRIIQRLERHRLIFGFFNGFFFHKRNIRRIIHRLEHRRLIIRLLNGFFFHKRNIRRIIPRLEGSWLIIGLLNGFFLDKRNIRRQFVLHGLYILRFGFGGNFFVLLRRILRSFALSLSLRINFFRIYFFCVRFDLCGSLFCVLQALKALFYLVELCIDFIERCIEISFASPRRLSISRLRALRYYIFLRRRRLCRSYHHYICVVCHFSSPLSKVYRKFFPRS